MIGADGALYAIRRELFVAAAVRHDSRRHGDSHGASIRAGRRVVFEDEARASEQGSETATEEFARKSRVIAGRHAVPARVATARCRSSRRRSCLSLVSHKALRWLSPLFATLRCCVQSSSPRIARVPLGDRGAGGVPVLWPARAACRRLRRLRVVGLAHYFCLVQAAAAVGFVRGLAGRQSVLWRRFVRVTAAMPVE